MAFSSVSTIKVWLAAPLVLLLVACVAVAPSAPGDASALDGLPLTTASRAALRADLDRIANLGTGRGCNDWEIEFLTVSLTGFAVGMDQPLTEPWSVSEQARFDALMRRWQALGGDTAGVSSACRSLLSPADLPVL